LKDIYIHGFMKKLLFTLVFAFLAIQFNSCCKGGSGGDATLVCTIYHHAKLIPGATVYIKYNAKEFPGESPGSYDNHVTATPTGTTVTFTGLHCGDYYLYGVGYDSAISLPVTGGLHFSISYSDRKKQVSTNVAVTE
jgi:hypothetical protein